MKHPVIFRSLILPLFLFFNSVTSGQLLLSEPELELKDNRVLINYTIENSLPSDTFHVQLEITDSTGRIVQAHALRGDIGRGVPGGRPGRITWEYTADHSDINRVLYFQVIAERENTAAALSETGAVQAGSAYKRGGLVLKSALFPGLGLSGYTGNPHWIKGVVGYGALTAGGYLLYQSNSGYAAYLQSEDPAERDHLYNRSISMKSYSNYLFYSAIGVWTIDLIWTILKTGDLKPGNNSLSSNRVRIFPVYQGNNDTRGILLSYHF